MADKYYWLNLTSSGTQLDLKINGVPLEVPSERTDFDTGEAINLWVAPGENQLSVKLEWPPEVGYAIGSAKFSAKLYYLAEGEQTEGQEAIAEIVWPKEGIDEYYPYEEGARFEVAPEDAPPAKIWSDAAKIDWSEREKSSVIEVVKALVEALDGKDLDAAVELLGYKARDVRAAHFITDEDPGEGLGDFLKFFFENEEWGIEPVDYENLEANFVARDRLVLISKEGMAPLLKSSNPEGPTLLLPLYFAMVDGRWTIAR